MRSWFLWKFQPTLKNHAIILRPVAFLFAQKLESTVHKFLFAEQQLLRSWMSEKA